MKTSVLIANYNYSNYICEAIDSILDQTHRPDQIIIVDDGSDDDSVSKVTEKYAGNTRLTLIANVTNRGQIFSLNQAYENASGDVIFFLDADDLYKPNHIENILNVFKERPDIDVVLSGYEMFGETEQLCLNSANSRCLGYSILSSKFDLDYYGKYAEGFCSTGAIHDRLAKKIFPFSTDWNDYSSGHADLPLMYGAAILGGKKYYVAEGQVRYRMHGSNHSSLSNEHAFNYLSYVLSEKIKTHYWEKNRFDEKTIPLMIPYEFRTITLPSKIELLNYCRLTWRTGANWRFKIKMCLKLLRYYQRQQKTTRT